MRDKSGALICPKCKRSDVTFSVKCTKCKNCMKTYLHSYYARTRNKQLKAASMWRVNNKDRRNAYKREYYKTHPRTPLDLVKHNENAFKRLYGKYWEIARDLSQLKRHISSLPELKPLDTALKRRSNRKGYYEEYRKRRKERGTLYNQKRRTQERCEAGVRRLKAKGIERPS